MIDPSHNAPIYKTENIASIFIEYEMTDMIMIPWKHSVARNSIAFFAEHNFPLMASCMKKKDEPYISAPEWAHWIRHYYLSKELKHGLMHCRWGYGFNSEETWDHLATVADHAWSIAPYIIHAPLDTAVIGYDINISAIHEGDKMVFDGQTTRPGPLPLLEALLHYRSHTDSIFKKVEMYGSNNKYTASIPHSKVKGNIVEYYITMTDKNNTTRCPKSSIINTYKIKIIEENAVMDMDMMLEKL
jgi:hypothetical protein